MECNSKKLYCENIESFDIPASKNASIVAPNDIAT